VARLEQVGLGQTAELEERDCQRGSPRARRR